MEIRKKLGAKKAEKSLEISAFLVFSRSDLNRPKDLAGAEGKREKNSRLLFFPKRPMKIRRKSSECIDAMVFDYIFEPSENQR